MMLVIYGPTATGKTTLAIELAQKYNGELISADSRQVYRGLDIGTGKVSFTSKIGKHQGFWIVDDVKIHGFDLVNPGQRFSVADFLTFANSSIVQTIKLNKLPIIVGGTGFYIKALINGIGSIGIPLNPKLRQQLEKLSTTDLYQKLLEINPKRAQSMNDSDRKNPRRLIRAIEISYKTVIFTVAVLVGLWFIIQIRQIIILVFLSIILLSALLRPVEWLTARRIPRVLSVLLVYIVLIALIAFVIGIIIPPLVAQTSDFISKLPQIVSTINNFLVFNKIPVENLSGIIASQIQQIAQNVLSIFKTIFSSIFLLITIFVFTFYLLLEWKSFVKLIGSPFSGRQEKKVTSIIAKVETGLGGWVRGQITLSLVVGILTFVGLTILQIPFALPLALVAGILAIVPIVGPIISAIPAILVGLTI